MPESLKHIPWLLVEGAVLLLLGVIALCAPLAAGLVGASLIGWVLIASGAFGLAATFVSHSQAHRGWSVAAACAALAVGVLLLIFPLVGTETLVLLVAAYLLTDGVATIGMAFEHRKKAAPWGWLMVMGLLTVILACLLVLMSALASATLVGVVVGLDLMVAGAALLVIHWAGGPTPHDSKA